MLPVCIWLSVFDITSKADAWGKSVELLHREPTFFWFSLVNSKSACLCPELRFKATTTTKSFCCLNMDRTTIGGRHSSAGWASDWKGGRHRTDAGSSPCCGKGFFSHSQLSVQTFRAYYVHTALTCSHMYRHLCVLKNNNAGSHTIVWTHGNTAHTDRNG